MRVDWRETREFLGLLTVTPLRPETYGLGLDLAERYQLSITDAMIAAAATRWPAARRCGCRTCKTGCGLGRGCGWRIRFGEGCGL